MTPLKDAILTEDVELVALRWRAERADAAINQALRGFEPVDGPEMLLSIVAPGERWEEISRQQARELISLGPFARTPTCPQCGRRFTTKQKTRVYCGDTCRVMACQQRKKRGEAPWVAPRRELTDEEWEAVKDYRCRKGHKATRENISIRRDLSVRRGFRPQCRLCRRASQQTYELTRRGKEARKKSRRAYEDRSRAERREKKRKGYAATDTNASKRTESRSSAEAA